MRIFLALGVCALLLHLTGCVVPVAKSTPLAGGLVYSNMRFTGDQSPTDNAQPGPRMGESSMSEVLWCVTTGNASISQAARNGGISKVKTVEHEYVNVLLVYQKYTTYVTGE